MNRVWTALLAGLLAPPSAWAFSTQIRLEVPAGTGVTRLELPAAVYAQAQTPDLLDLRIDNSAGEPLAWAWSPQVAPDAVPWRLEGEPVAGDWRYAVPLALAPRVRAINAELPVANSVLPLTLGHYLPAHTRDEPPQFRAQAELTFFRLDHAGGERRSAPLAIAPFTVTPWILRPQTTLPATAMPALLLHWQPQVLVFNPRGRAPFTLRVGAAAAVVAAMPGAAQPLSQVAPGYSQQELLSLPQTRIGVVQVSAAAPVEAPVVESAEARAARERRWLLWAILGGGLLLLAGLSWRLYRQTQHGADVDAPP